MPVFDSAGRYCNLVFLTSKMEGERMIEVILRKRPNAVWAQELLFVEHVSQNALQLFLVADRSHPAICDSR